MRHRVLGAITFGLWTGLALIAGLGLIGCASPVSAAATAPPLHHNIPATDPAGSVWYVCETQPRSYCLNGACRLERDHYLQRSACPAIPIN